MAEKRMFSKKVTDSDAFIEMSSATQALYFHLNQGADDEGFNNQVQNAMFKAHASIDDLKILMAKNFIIRFESGVIVIKHWWIHNTLRKDRFIPTNFQEELKQLGIKDNKAYTLDKNGCQTVAKRLPNGCQTVAADKYSIVENSIDKVSIEEENSNLLSYNQVIEIAKTECPTCYNRFQKKIDSGKIEYASRLQNVLDDLQGQITYEDIRQLFCHANKTYIISPKYLSLDILWVLTNIQSVKAAEEREMLNNAIPNVRGVTQKTADELNSIFDKINPEDI